MVEIDCSNLEFTCPRCGSHNVRVFSSELFPVYKGVNIMCDDCKFGRTLSPFDVIRTWEVQKKEPEKISHKTTVLKHRVIRTYPSGRISNPTNSLTIAFSQGWKVIMCNPIGNELEYILEKEEEDLDND